MMIRRMFAGSIVALLLSVSPLAAACDLSCALGSMNSNCHSEQAKSQDSMPDGMKMDGMAMTGMKMPEIPAAQDQGTFSAIARAKANHPSIGAMGSCERRSCDGGSAVSTKTPRSVDSHIHSVLAAKEIRRPGHARTLFRGARDGIAMFHLRDGIPLQLSLRI
jgi:hypothetical protein